MPPSTISFIDHCPICGRNVSASPILSRVELTTALAGNADIRVVHLAEAGDHVWSLNDQQKANLRKRMAEGPI
jgi:hypothetical protein